MSPRTLRVVHVGPEHPARQRSAATVGMGTREDGVQSSVRISIDLGLKTEQLGAIDLSVEQATEFIEKLVIATGQARRANQ